MTTTKKRLNAARAVAAEPDRLAELIGLPVGRWVGRCHEVSLALLKTGEFGPGRVARGNARNVTSQHSWIVLGEDVYDEHAVIVDATNPVFHKLYNVGGQKGSPVLVSARATGITHWPHGMGYIWSAGPPQCGGEKAVKLTPGGIAGGPLSDAAQDFLQQLGPLDRRGWSNLANGPMQGWPAGEIIAAMDDTKALRALVPIDILGMLTDRNPGGLYLAGGEPARSPLRMTGDHGE